MVARRAQERHVEPFKQRVDVIPFGVQLRLVFGVPFDQITHVDLELWLQQIDLSYSKPERVFDVCAVSTITDDQKLDILKSGVERLETSKASHQKSSFHHKRIRLH